MWNRTSNLEIRSEHRYSRRAFRRTLETHGAPHLKSTHATVDAAVLAAYGFSAKADLLAQLLALNQTVAAQIASGTPVTAPGIPATFPTPATLITADCIRPDECK